jgi:hypothetical protein
MLEAPTFLPADPVRDIQAPDEIGRVESVRGDGSVCVRWYSGRSEWVHKSTIQFAPGFTPKRPRR